MAALTMLEVLTSGKLIRDPQARIGQSGKPYTTALLRVDTGEESQTLVSVIAFGEVAERLGRLKAGDGVAVAGSAKLSSWEKDGETRHGLSLTASAVLSAYDVKRRRGSEAPSDKTGSDKTGKDKPARALEPAFDDAIPF